MTVTQNCLISEFHDSPYDFIFIAFGKFVKSGYENRLDQKLKAEYDVFT